METLVMIKPDGIEMKCTGPIIGLIEDKDLKITQMIMKTLGLTEAELIYAEHKGQWYFERNINHVTSDPVVLMQVEGDDVIEKTRKIVDDVRKNFNIELPKNIIHASSNADKAIEELQAAGF